SLQRKDVNDRKKAYTGLANNLSPVDPQHNHALLVRLSSCEGFLMDAALHCREDLFGCAQLQQVGEKLARCLCGYGGESMRAHLNYCGSYEPAIPPIVRIDGFTEDLPGGGIRFDIPVVVADGLKSNASQTVSRKAGRSPVERRRSKPLSTD
ncbi:hypothetical protein FOZ62_022918, partial [Perkinsus olseni]